MNNHSCGDTFAKLSNLINSVNLKIDKALANEEEILSLLNKNDVNAFEYQRQELKLILKPVS